MTDAPATSQKRHATASDYLNLMKPRIMMLVVFTGFAGLVAATGMTGITMHPAMAAIATLAVALGSGAAAMVLGRHSENLGSHKLVGGFFRAATQHHQLCVGSLDGMTTDTRGLLEAATEVAKLAWEAAADKVGWYDMAYYVLHQVSQVHTQAVIDTLGIDGDRVPRSFPTHGNIGPAAIPVTLAAIQHDLQPGDGVMLQGMGSGINAAIVEIRW